MIGNSDDKHELLATKTTQLCSSKCLSSQEPIYAVNDHISEVIFVSDYFPQEDLSTSSRVFVVPYLGQYVEVTTSLEIARIVQHVTKNDSINISIIIGDMFQGHKIDDFVYLIPDSVTQARSDA